MRKRRVFGKHVQRPLGCRTDLTVTDTPPEGGWHELIVVQPLRLDGTMIAHSPVGPLEYQEKDSADVADMLISLAARIRKGQR